MILERAVTWTLSRRVTVFVVAVMFVVVGVISIRRLSLELLPKGLQEHDISVVIPVSAANPVEVQETIVRPTEELLRTVPGIKRLVSSAGANEAWLDLEFSKDVDLDLAAAEVRDRLERARLVWPPEVRRYRIFRFNFDTDLPVFQFGIVIQQPSDELTFLIEEKIVKPLEAIPGVARVQCRGLLDDQVRIFVNQQKALAAGVNLYELTRALEAGNVDVSGGEVEEGGVRYSLKSSGRFRDLDDVRNFPVRPGLKLGQLATVEPTKTVRDFIVLSRTSPTLWCRVQKESSANTVETCARVREALEQHITPDARLKELGVSFFFFDWGDVGAVITGALGNLGQTAFEGGWLSLLVLIFFLRRVRLTVLIGLAIPLSLLITGIWVAATGGTLSLLAMIGVTVAIGMLVDDAIVVVEAIQHKREEGFSPMEAARRGTSEIALAVVLSTFTTVVAFVPIMFMGGDTEMTFFLSGIGLPLCYATLASLVVALLFVPLGTVMFYGWKKTPRADARWIARIRRSYLIEWMIRAYARTLGATIRHRFVSILAFVIPIAALTTLAWNLMPPLTSIMGDDGGRIEVNVRLDANFTLKDAHAAFLDLGAAVEKLGPEIGLKHFWCFFERSGGELLVFLDHKDVVKTKEAAKRLKAELPRPPGVRVQTAVQSDRQQDGLRFNVYGDDVVRLADIANEVAEVIETVPGVLRVKNDLRTAEGEIHIVPDREKLQRFGIVPESLWGTVQYGVRGFPLNELQSGEREIPLIIQFEGGEDQTLGELRETPLFTRRGAQVPMSAVADVGVTRGFGEIRREGGRARARLIVDTAEEDTDALRKKISKRLSAHLLPVGFSYEDNRGAELNAEVDQMKLAVLMSVIFVFLLMGIMFESFILPLAVTVAVPFSWAGGVMALGFCGVAIDFVGMISAILLVGIVVKNGIVLIDCVARLRTQGLGQHDALVQAGRLRLRPIVMTALTTVLGLVPMALAKATGSQVSYRSLAIATIGGLVLATLVTLYLTPIAYSLFDDLRGRFSRDVRALVARRRDRAPAASSPS